MTTIPPNTVIQRRLRTLAAGSAFVFVLGALAGCGLIPGLPGANSGTTVESELVGTTWSGQDSDGDEWDLELQADGTVGLTYNGSSYDDATDTWTHSGDVLAVLIGFDDGPVNLVGQYGGLNAPIEMDGSYSGGSFTLTLTRG